MWYIYIYLRTILSPCSQLEPKINVTNLQENSVSSSWVPVPIEPSAFLLQEICSIKKNSIFLNVYVYVCVIHMYVHKCTHIYIYLYHARYVGASKTCKNNEEVFTRNWLVISSLNHPTLCQNSLTRTCVKTGTLGSSAMTSLETSAVP